MKKKYLEEIEELYFAKKLKDASYHENIVFRGKFRNYSLAEVKAYEEKVKLSRTYSEVNAIYREIIENNKIVFYHTRTNDSRFNIKNNVSTDEMNRVLKLQYQELYKYHSFINESTRLRKQSVKFFDVSDNLNIHTHNIDIIQKFNDIKAYIKTIIFSNLKSPARTELLVTKNILEYIKKIFEDFSIRVKNRYRKLCLKQIGNKFYIKGLDNKLIKGIYFKALKDDEKSILKMIKYFYKNVLTERYEKFPSKRHLVCNRSKIRIKQFSKNFFNIPNVNKHILYRTSNKLFSMFKSKSKQIKQLNLTPTKEDTKSFIYYTADLFKKHILRHENNEYVKFIYFIKRNKWIEILNLKSYEKEGFLDDESNKRCLSRGKDFLSKFDRNIRTFYKELEIRNIKTSGEFIKRYEKKGFYVKSIISKLWVGYLEYLHYCIGTIGLNDYMEELIHNYKSTPNKIKEYSQF